MEKNQTGTGHSTRAIWTLILSSPCVLALSPLWRSGSFSPPEPAAWGSDHVGKPIPEYVSGDECLFCHRMNIGPAWGENRHNRTMRDIDLKSPALAALKNSPSSKDFAGEVKIVLGGEKRQRFLKPAAGYGKLDLLNIAWLPPHGGKAGELIISGQAHWEIKRFGDACAGCHATAVDARERTFSARSLDCYVCHGEVSLQHSKDTTLVHLARKRKDAAKVVTSICAQCHVRTGNSKSTGLPYPNNFVAGDNLFRDLQVDFSTEQIKRQNPADAHVLENVRDVTVLGKLEVTCLSCHEVHKQSARKHHLVAQSDLCLHCHNPSGSKKFRKPYEVHSRTCEY